MTNSLGATSVAKVRAFSAGLAGRVGARRLYGRFARMCYVISLGYAGRRHRRAAGAIATSRALRRRATTFGEPLAIICRVAQLDFLAHPAILQFDFWIGVPIR